MAEKMSVKAILSAQDSGFTSTLGKAQSVVGNLASTVKSGIGFGILAGAGQQAFSLLTNSVGGFVRETISAGANFESAMSSVAAISGATGDDLAMLTEKAKEMGAKTKFSATESANAMEYMAMAGWKAEDMVSGIEGVMNLAAASGADLARTSDIVTDALTAFGQSASDSGRFADVMAAASANANTNVELMGETFKYVGAAAGAMGYSIEDVAVATGLMANSGIKGSQAGTALRSTITRLAKPTKESKEAMEALGLSITDSEGNMKSFGDIMLDMRKGMQGMTEDQKASYAAMLGGQEAMSGLLAIANASEEDFNKLTEAINNCSGSAEAMAKIKLDNLQGDITILKSGLEGLGITIFSKFADPFRSATKMVTEAVSKINERLSESNGIETFLENAGKYVSVFIDTAKEVGSYLGEAVSAIRSSFAEINGEFGSTESVDNFKDAMESVANVIKKVASFATEHSDAIAKLIKWLPAIALGIKGFKIAKAVAPGVAVFAKSIAGLATKGISGIASKLFGISSAQKVVGSASVQCSSQMLASAKSFMMLGAGVLMVAAGFALLAYSAIQLANAGGPAIAVMFGLVGALGALMAGMTAMMKTVTTSPAKLKALSTVMLSLGASILMVAVGFSLLAQSAIALSDSGGVAIAVMFGMVGALAALSIGMMAMMKTVTASPAKLTAMATAMLAMGAAVLMISAGFWLLSDAAIGLANAGGPATATMFCMVGAIAALMVVAAAVAPALSAGAVGLLAFGTAVLIAAAGMALLSFAAIQLANAGTPAVIALVALTACLAGLMVVAAVAAPLLTVGAVGFLAFGAAIALVGAGALLASIALQNVAAVLPVVVEYGTQAAVSLLELGGSLLVFAAGALAAGASALVLGAGFLVAGAGVLVLALGLAAAGAASQVATTGFTMLNEIMPQFAATCASSAAQLAIFGAALLAFGAGALVAGAGALVLSAGLLLVGAASIVASAGMEMISAVLPLIVEDGKASAASLALLGAAMLVFGAGALVAGASALVLSAGLLAAGAGAAVLGAGLTVVSAAVLLIATGFSIISSAIVTAAVGLYMMSSALDNLTAGSIKTVAKLAILGAELAAFGTEALIAGAGALTASAGILALSISAMTLGAGLLMVSSAITVIAVLFPVITVGAKMNVAVFKELATSAATLSAGLISLTASMGGMVVTVAASAAAITAFGAGAVVAVAGIVALSIALKSVESSMKSIAASAKTTEHSLQSMVAAVNIVSNGLNTLGNKAKNAMASLTAAFKSAEAKVKTSGMQVGNGFAQGMQPGLNKAVAQAKNSVKQMKQTFTDAISVVTNVGNSLGNGFAQGTKRGFTVAVNTASSTVSQIASKLRSGYSSVYSAGAYIAQGLASGMRSQLGAIRSAAAQMAAAADAAVRAKAKIHSPSKVSTKEGEYWGQGWINGILGKVKESWKAASKLVSFPNAKMPNLAMAYGGELSADYEYYSNSEYTIEVPLNVDGREFAKATATYTQEELDKRQMRSNRKKGKL